LYLIASVVILAVIAGMAEVAKHNSPRRGQAQVARGFSPWHVAQIKTFFESHPLKPRGWVGDVEDVHGPNVSVRYTAFDTFEPALMEATVRMMCPPADSQIWFGANAQNAIYINVRKPLEPTSSLAWGVCKGPGRAN
jgi:hypothetical protein